MFLRLLNIKSAVVPTFDQTIKWTKILSNFFSFQVALQTVSAITGILIIRALDKQEYALYTILYSMQSAITILSELGVSSVVLSIGGKVWDDRFAFGTLFNSANQLRIQLLIIATLFITPVMIYLLMSQGGSILFSFLVAVILITDLYLKISTNLMSVIFRFHSEISFLVKTEILAQLLRLFLIFVAITIYPNTTVLVFLTLIGSVFHNYLLSQATFNKIDKSAPVRSDYKNQMISVVKTQVVYSLFFVLQGQITIFIISFFGRTESISDVGALSRLTLVFNVFLAAVVNFVSPRFSKDEPISKLRRLYLIVVITFLLFSSIVLLFTTTFSEYFLWLLGSKYDHLSNELLFMVFLTLITSFNGVIYSLNYSRGWINHNWIIIPTTITIQILLASFMDLTAVENVIIFGILSAVPTFALNLFMSMRRLQYFGLGKGT